MQNAIHMVIQMIDRFNEWIGKIVSILILVFGLILFYGVIMRYIFNASVFWEPDVCWMLFVIMAVLAGPYVLQQNFHCRLDVIYTRLSQKGRIVMDIITFPLFAIFVGTLTWYAIEEAWWSTSILESNAMSHFHGPIYPAKIAWAVAAFLLLIQGIAEFTCNVLFLFGIKIERNIS